MSCVLIVVAAVLLPAALGGKCVQLAGMKNEQCVIINTIDVHDVGVFHIVIPPIEGTNAGLVRTQNIPHESTLISFDGVSGCPDVEAPCRVFLQRDSFAVIQDNTKEGVVPVYVGLGANSSIWDRYSAVEVCSSEKRVYLHRSSCKNTCSHCNRGNFEDLQWYNRTDPRVNNNAKINYVVTRDKVAFVKYDDRNLDFKSIGVSLFLFVMTASCTGLDALPGWVRITRNSDPAAFERDLEFMHVAYILSMSLVSMYILTGDYTKNIKFWPSLLEGVIDQGIVIVYIIVPVSFSITVAWWIFKGASQNTIRTGFMFSVAFVFAVIINMKRLDSMSFLYVSLVVMFSTFLNTRSLFERRDYSTKPTLVLLLETASISCHVTMLMFVYVPIVSEFTNTLLFFPPGESFFCTVVFVCMALPTHIIQSYPRIRVLVHRLLYNSSHTLI